MAADNHTTIVGNLVSNTIIVFVARAILGANKLSHELVHHTTSLGLG